MAERLELPGMTYRYERFPRVRRWVSGAVFVGGLAAIALAGFWGVEEINKHSESTTISPEMPKSDMEIVQDRLRATSYRGAKEPVLYGAVADHPTQGAIIDPIVIKISRREGEKTYIAGIAPSYKKNRYIIWRNERDSIRFCTSDSEEVRLLDTEIGWDYLHDRPDEEVGRHVAEVPPDCQEVVNPDVIR